MTFRLYDVIENELHQDFKFELDRPQVVSGFYPYLYMKNLPLGNFTFEVYSGEVKVFSKAFTAVDIKLALDTDHDSAYVFYPVLCEPYLLLGKGTFKAIIKSSGYLPNENSHLGWIRSHKFLVNRVDYQIDDDSKFPFSLKMKVLERASEL